MAPKLCCRAIKILVTLLEVLSILYSGRHGSFYLYIHVSFCHNFVFVTNLNYLMKFCEIFHNLPHMMFFAHSYSYFHLNDFILCIGALCLFGLGVPSFVYLYVQLSHPCFFCPTFLSITSEILDSILWNFHSLPYMMFLHILISVFI